MRSLQLVEFGKPLDWRVLETPRPTGREVLVKVRCCGVCHSDLHLWEGYYPLEEGRRLYVKDRGVTLPLTLGHEIVGEVVALGPEAEGVAIGDLRLVYPWIGCGVCGYCTRDQPNLCDQPRSLGVFADGGYGEYVCVPDVRYLLEIGQMPPERACSLACAGLTAYSALKKALLSQADEPLLIIGAGGLGLMATYWAKHLTSAPIIVADVNQQRLESARRLGAEQTVNTRTRDLRAIAMEMTGGLGLRAIVDFVNNSETAAQCFGLLAKNGKLVMVGLFGGELTVPCPVLPTRNLSLLGSYTGSLVELRELVQLALEKGLPEIPVEIHPPEAANELLQRLKQGEIAGRAVLAMPAKSAM